MLVYTYGLFQSRNWCKAWRLTCTDTVFCFFVIVLNDAFRDCNQGIYIRYRSSGKLFNIHRFAAQTKVLLALARDLLYADDCDLVAHTESDMQCFMDRLSEACRAFGLAISLGRTVVMFQPASGTVYVEPSIYTNGKKLKVVDKCTYLGSTINRFCLHLTTR